MVDLSFLDEEQNIEQSPVQVDPSNVEETPAASAQEQAQIIKMFLDAGVDSEGIPIIYRHFGKPEVGGMGGVGSIAERISRTDVFPREVEKLLGPEYLKKIEEIYGSSEISVPREDADLLERITTRLIGRTPTESERETAELASARAGSTDFFARYFAEKFDGKVPTIEEMKGVAPEGASAAERVLLSQFGYRPATDKITQQVELEYYGRTPLRDPEAFKDLTKNANVAIRWFAELPKGEGPDGQEYSVAEDIIGQILLTDINSKYGTENKQYLLEDLELKVEKTAAGPRLTFLHPDGEGRQAIDPVTFDWSDVLDQLPGAYVIMADVLGSIGGGIAGAPAGPKGIFLGATAGGAIGAMTSKFMVMNKALRMGGFTYDHSKGGYTSQKGGKDQVIPLENIMDNVVDEGLWSAGGSVLGSAIFRIGKAILTKGGAEAEYFVRKEDWDNAYRRWGENKFGKKFNREKIPSRWRWEGRKIQRGYCGYLCKPHDAR